MDAALRLGGESSFPTLPSPSEETQVLEAPPNGVRNELRARSESQVSLSHQDINLVRQFLRQTDPDVILLGHEG